MSHTHTQEKSKDKPIEGGPPYKERQMLLYVHTPPASSRWRCLGSYGTFRRWSFQGRSVSFGGFKVWPHFLFSTTWLSSGLAFLAPRLSHPDETWRPGESLSSSKLLFHGVFCHFPEGLFFHSLWLCRRVSILPRVTPPCACLSPSPSKLKRKQSFSPPGSCPR